MRNKSFKKLGAAVMAAVLTMSSFGGMTTVSAAAVTQMSSEKEVVYVNSYGDTAREQNFDSNWKFYMGAASGAENANFDDSNWRTLNLPHDYSIEQEYTAAGEAESAYLLGGTGWYRKHFSLDESLKGKEIRIDFGGVYMNATVWVNGEQLGTHPYGYTPFSFDITDYVKFDEENVITVKVDHQTPSSRWYSGSGIYRSVNLTVMDKVHVDLFGTKIDAPNLEKEVGKTVNMTVKTTVANEGTATANVALVHTIYEKGTENSIGTVTTAAQSVAAGTTAEIEATLPAEKPELWDTENPNLYTVVTEVKVGNDVVDTYETEYGFRYVKFDRNTGFYLNGENVKLKGVCMHHDQGSLGSEAHYRAIERQVEILKEMGCNSIRVTHNPAADELIEICNAKGILVIDEFFDGWHRAKNGNYNDYSVWFSKAIEDGNEILGAESGMLWSEFDLKATIGRGENAPSVIMWSLGNEIQEGAGGTGYATWADSLIEWCQETGTTKILTIGSNAVKNGDAEQCSVADKVTAAGGVSGTNYSNGSSYDALFNSHANWIIYGSETASHVNSRGVYNVTGSQQLNADKALTSYDYSAVGWGAVASSAWYDVITRDFVAGEYVWTGFDYMGEPTPNNGTDSGWKNGTDSPKNSFFGIIDTAGLPKDNYYFYQSQWNDEVNTLHVLPAWNRDVLQNPNNVPVVVYSDAASVKLTLTTADGTVKDLGTKTFVEKTTAAGYKYQMASANSTNHRDMYFTWYVPFEEGTLTATAYDKAGNVITDTVGRSSVTTTGNEAKLDVTVDRDTINADGKDLAYITVNVTDADGNIVPDAKNNVKFNVAGDGVLVGVDNGKQSDHQSFQDDNRNAFNGSLIAIVQATKEAGEFTVTATAAGLESDSVTVTTESTGATAETSFYMSRNYYVKVGEKPVLPETIETRLGDGTTKELPVVWDKIDAADYANAGTFSVNGVVDDMYSVSVIINMIDEVGGILNYSTTTPVGVPVTLPEARPAVLIDGEIIDANFPVEWDKVPAGAYDEAGTFVVEGTADVFGQEYDVTSSVRVQNEILTIVGRVDNPHSLTQDIPEDLQSDTLTAIWDNNTAIGANTDGGANETAWSNYDASQAGDNTAEIVFEYATQQRIGEITIHFWKDGYSAEFPDAGTTEIYVSETGAEGSWTKLDAKEVIGTEADRVKPYTYSFEPVPATFIKFCLTNSSAQKTAKTCTGITEIEIMKVQGTFATNTEAALEAATVAGTALTDAELAAGVAYTLSKNPTVKATGAGNAAVTVLPVYDGKVLVILESEDHKTTSTFTIFVGQEKPLDPSDASNDIPVSDTIAISESQYLPGTANEGPDDYILDGNAQTHWHTDWQTSEATNVAKRWVGVELKEAAAISGIRYLPRNNGSNGAVTEYKVQIRETDNGEWIDVASGTWDRTDSRWKLVTFPSVTAKQVRVVGVHTWADSGNDAHMSAAEFRVVKGSETTKPVDKAALTEAIEAAEALTAEDYVDFSAVETALAAAKAVAENDKATQAEVFDAADALNAAINALVEKEEPPVEEEDEVVRLFGDSRYETGYAVADALKAVLGVEKFEAVVVATGKNFADALAGSYLAVEKNAPILLTNGKDDNVAQLHEYIAANVTAGGKVYILGGEGAVPATVDTIKGYDVVRLFGDSRYDTNLAILEEAGVTGDSIIVATGKNFADSLSASAAKLPILLVKPNATLNDAQKAILAGMKNIYIVGGEGAVSAEYEAELAAFGTVTRVYGDSRYDTSVEVAKTFCGDVTAAVVASGKNFPDGLCGGPLAAALNAPLVLTKDGGASAAAGYVAENGIAGGFVLGGDGALTDATVVEVFALDSAAEIK